MITLVIFSILLGILLALIIFIAVCEESYSKYFYAHLKEQKNNISLTFKQFIEFYSLNPRAYTWSTNYYLDCYLFYIDEDFNRHYLSFKSLLDAHRFIKWNNNKKQQRKKLNDIKNKQLFLECVKKDIAKQDQQAQEELNKGYDTLKEVL